MNAWHTTISPPPDIDVAADAAEVADDADRRARLVRLDRRARSLERERLAARATRARLVALDIELCRVEAAKRMLAPSAPAEPES